MILSNYFFLHYSDFKSAKSVKKSIKKFIYKAYIVIFEIKVFIEI